MEIIDLSYLSFSPTILDTNFSGQIFPSGEHQHTKDPCEKPPGLRCGAEDLSGVARSGTGRMFVCFSFRLLPDAYLPLPGHVQRFGLQRAVLHLRGHDHGPGEGRGQPAALVPAVSQDKLRTGQALRQRRLQRQSQPDREGSEFVSTLDAVL